MRITKNKIKKKNDKVLEGIVLNNIPNTKDFTLSMDFTRDIYMLFKKRINRSTLFKNQWEIFNDIRKMYVQHKMMDLMKNVGFYMKVRTFLKAFISSQLFWELNKLDPLEAVEAFLKMFQPPQQQPSQESSQEQDDYDSDSENIDQNGDLILPGGKGKNKSKPKDQGGTSADEINIPIDMTKFRQEIPKIEKALESGILDKEDLQEQFCNSSGTGRSQLKIQNIVELVDKMARYLGSRNLEIFYVARKKEITDIYRVEQIITSVPYPDNEMDIKTIDNPMEILKTIPTQYAYDDDIFMNKLIKKELLIRDYQSRNLKKQVLYLLIDVSGSMTGSKNIYASGVGLAFVRQAVEEGATYFLRFFDDYPKDLHVAKTKEDAKNLCSLLIRQPYSGGGTNIQRAILTAVEDIKKSPDKFEKAEIMVITDGVDNVDLNKESLKGVKVHSTVIDGKNSGLEKISDSYIELNSSEKLI